MAHSFCHPYMQSINEETSNFDIDTDCFTRPDLALFVESLETISRLERQKHERRLRRKERKCPIMDLVQQIQNLKLSAQAYMPPQNSEPETDCTISAPSGDEAENEPIIKLETKQLPSSSHNTPVKTSAATSGGKLSPTQSDYDETYFSAPNSQQNSPRSSVTLPYNKQHFNYNYNTKLNSNASNNANSNSDSEESGVFPVGEADEHPIIYENVPPLRARSVVVTKPIHRTMRSRIIGLVLKREYVVSPPAPPAAVPSKKEQKKAQKQRQAAQKAEQLRAEQKRDERRNRLIDNLLKQSMSSLATKANVRRGVAIEDGSVEARFLNKALRYLTL